MRQFVRDMVVGLTSFCVVWIIGELAFDLYKGQNDYSYKYNYIKNNPAIKTLLIGHSHFENGLNPYLLGDSTFDCAMGGRGRWMGWDVQLAGKLYVTMPNLKTIIYPLSYSAPFESPHYRKPVPSNVQEYLYFYSRYMHAYYDRFPQNLFYSSALAFNKMGPNYWVDKNVDSLGYRPYKGQCENWKNMHNTNDVSFFVGEIADLCYQEYIGYMIQLAKTCYDNNIRFIVVTCPHSNAFLQNTHPDVLCKIFAVVDSVRKFYPVDYYNYIDDEEFREDSLYYNASHLNSVGADLFAIRVRKDINM